LRDFFIFALWSLVSIFRFFFPSLQIFFCFLSAAGRQCPPRDLPPHLPFSHFRNPSRGTSRHSPVPTLPVIPNRVLTRPATIFTPDASHLLVPFPPYPWSFFFQTASRTPTLYPSSPFVHRSLLPPVGVSCPPLFPPLFFFTCRKSRVFLPSFPRSFGGRRYLSYQAPLTSPPTTP